MKIRHLVRVNVRGPGEDGKAVLKTAEGNFRSRFLRRLLGDRYGVLVVTPVGTTVDSVEIHETRKDD